MEAHIDTTCPKTVIKCKYSEFGCEHEVSKLELNIVSFFHHPLLHVKGGKISTYIVSQQSLDFYNDT